jgi:ribose-phosphate pyrophosphokinase
MPYQQADKDFGIDECFSLKTIANLINSMDFETVFIFDAHSDVSPALIDNCYVYDNSAFISKVIDLIYQYRYHQVMNSFMLPDSPDYVKKMLGYDTGSFYNELAILATDAGSYKKIFKLCEKLNFKGEIITCSKSRNHDTGEITTVVPEFDEKKTVLIIDDIALGSRTFLNIRKELKNGNVFLAVSHGIFNENIDKLETEFTKVFTTNSRRDDSVGKNIEVIKIF